MRSRRRDTRPSSSEDDSENIAHSPSPTNLPHSSIKKHRTTSERTRLIATSSSKRQSRAKSSLAALPEFAPGISHLPPPSREPLVDRDETSHNSTKSAVPVFEWIWNVVRSCIRLLKVSITILLCLFLFGWIASQPSYFVHTVLSPLCIIPGFHFICSSPSSTLTLPLSISEYSDKQQTESRPRWADYPRLIDVQSKALEALLDETVDGSSLALQIKKAEMAIADLATLVKFSDLQSRDELAGVLKDFMNDARKMGRALTTVSTKVRAVVDNLLAVNDYALHAINAANSESNALSALTFSKATPRVVLSTFVDVMNVLSYNTGRIVLEAEFLLGHLNDLEAHLLNIHEIVARDDTAFSTSRVDLLADLWVMLGGHQRELRDLETNLDLLKNMGQYRKMALARVVAVLQTLHGMSEDIEDLRATVTVPQLVGQSIPVDVHMKSIQGGLDRLQEKRLKAKEMEEVIVGWVMKGVDRD